MNDLLTTLGIRVAARRREHGMTQRELADAIGLSRTSVTNIEAGRQGDIGVAKLVALAEALKTSVADLTATPASVTNTSAWLDLARRVTASQREYERLAERCWRDHDYLTAVRYRGIAEGLEMARDHHLAVVAATKPSGGDGQ